jgi:twinfilin-like protein
MKVQISDDLVMNLIDSVQENGSFEDDLSSIQSYFQQNEPCYVLARTDKKNQRDQYRWNLFCYVPDRAPVRMKMLYASSRSNLRTQLGDDYFTDEIFGTVPSDFNLQGYKSYIKHKESEVPLTREEEKIMEDKEQGVFVGGGGTGGAYSHGVKFPVDDDVNDAMEQLKSGTINYVQITIDIDAERVKLCDSLSIEIGELGSYISLTEPRFHFYKYDHNFEGENVTSYIYIYSCPDGSGGTTSAPVKMRMLFSSSKQNVESLLTSRDVKVALKMEVNNGEDVNEDEILKVLHPQKEVKKKINKPTPRGGRKLIRNG